MFKAAFAIACGLIQGVSDYLHEPPTAPTTSEAKAPVGGPPSSAPPSFPSHLYTGRRIVKMWEHRGWGNTVSWWDKLVNNKIHGHLSFRLKRGDLVEARMQSGRNAYFVVTDVRQMMDPKDQFFADVAGLGYVDEPHDELVRRLQEMGL